jgi:hypothetical protein
LRFSLLAIGPINFLWRIAFRTKPWGETLTTAASASMPWLGWFLILTLLNRMSGGAHPPTEPGALSPVRRVIAIGSLVLFVLLFMPTPWMSY